MTRGKMNWIEIPATDQNESISFYEKVFGWKIDPNESNPEYPMFYDGAGSGGRARTGLRSSKTLPATTLRCTRVPPRVKWATRREG